MEKHRCGLCFRRFSSGRALGGHMRRHVTAAAPPAPKLNGHQCSAVDVATEGSEEEEELSKGAAYGLRENPRKSFRLVDPEFSHAFAALEPAGSSSVVVQDGESETESPCATAASHRRRSKRPRLRSGAPPPEPASSASDATTEEDVARCLMMLSRDSWTTAGKESPPSEGDEEEGDGRQIARPPRRGRSKYQCRTCRKVFRSYQALGGHRASHQISPSGCIPAVRSQPRSDDDFDAKVHECPFCFRVFNSGQALGGHKRSHLASSATSPAPLPPPSSSPPTTSTSAAAKCGDGFGLIDLNLPAPPDDDTALSAVSDAEFIANHTVS